MSHLIDIAIANAITAGILAVVVLLATKIYTNPRFARVLWLLVLVKLVTPPLWTLPLQPALSPLYSSTALGEPASPAEAQASQQDHPTRLPAASGKPGRSTTQPPPTIPSWVQPIPWRMVVAAAWGLGSIAWLLVAVYRIARFQQTLRVTDEIDESTREICLSVATAMGLRALPRMGVSNADVGPMVWPIGTRPTVLLPQTLLQTSSAHELQLLISHEYAHLKRRDHWVRWFELFVCSLYWWHPAYWIARRRSRQAEEYCCDALVLECMTQADARCYANVLLKAAEFAARLEQHPPRLASCMGSRDSLKGRIQMILGDTTSIRLSLTASLLSLAIAIVVLPVSVAAFQKAGSKEDRAEPTPATRTDAGHEEDGTLGHARPLGVRRVALPAEPFRIEAGYILEIRVPEDNTFVGEPINDDYLVQPGGNVSLGPTYGRVHVAGLTLEEAEQAVTEHLKKILTNASATVTLGGWRLPDIGYPLGYYEQTETDSDSGGIMISLDTLRRIAAAQREEAETEVTPDGEDENISNAVAILSSVDVQVLVVKAETQREYLLQKLSKMRRVLELALVANQVSLGSVPEATLDRLKQEIETSDARAKDFTIDITELIN